MPLESSLGGDDEVVDGNTWVVAPHECICVGFLYSRKHSKHC